jgi:hypothetical protein
MISQSFSGINGHPLQTRLTEQPRLDVGRHLRDLRIDIPDLIQRDVRDVGQQVGDITSRVGKLFGNVEVSENLVETLEH